MSQRLPSKSFTIHHTIIFLPFDATHSLDIDSRSVVGIAIDYWLDGGCEFEFGQDQEFFSSRRSDRLWDPPNVLFKGYRGLFPRGVKRPGCEADHSPPASAEVKKTWIYTSTPAYDFIA
jgi:hypothetical protein